MGGVPIHLIMRMLGKAIGPGPDHHRGAKPMSLVDGGQSCSLRSVGQRYLTTLHTTIRGTGDGCQRLEPRPLRQGVGRRGCVSSRCKTTQGPKVGNLPVDVCVCVRVLGQAALRDSCDTSHRPGNSFHGWDLGRFVCKRICLRFSLLPLYSKMYNYCTCYGVCTYGLAQGFFSLTFSCLPVTALLGLAAIVGYVQFAPLAVGAWKESRQAVGDRHVWVLHQKILQ